MTRIRRPDWTIRPAQTIELDRRLFAKIAKSHNWLTTGSYDYGRVAAELGVSQRQAYRVLDGESRPGTGFLGGLLAADEEFDPRELFHAVSLQRPTTEE